MADERKSTTPGSRQTPAVLGDHEVGYGRPPKQHQFKPGEQNNPKGRKPKRPVTLGVNIADVLMEAVTVVDKAGRKSKRPFAEVLLQVTKQKALAGDAKARSDLLHLMMQFRLLNVTKSETRTITIELVNPEGERRRVYQRNAPANDSV